MSGRPGPGANTARGRGEPPRGRGGVAATVTRRVAILFVVIALVVGGLLGYLARGGPDQPSDLTLVTDIPTVTVTVPRSP